jgi:hypothetical protein
MKLIHAPSIKIRKHNFTDKDSLLLSALDFAENYKPKSKITQKDYEEMARCLTEADIIDIKHSLYQLRQKRANYRQYLQNISVQTN